MGRSLQNMMAWSQYPDPAGTVYFEIDVADADRLSHLFDLAQVHRAYITREGWRAIWERFGLAGLLAMNKDGRWFDPDERLAAEQILHRSRVAGYDPAHPAVESKPALREMGLFALAGDS